MGNEDRDALIRAVCQGPRSVGGEIQFRGLLDTLPVAAFTCDADGLITYFNQEAAKAWGRQPLLNDPADRFCGSFRLFSTEDGSLIPHADCWMARALREGKSYNCCEIIIERSDGTRVVGLAHANPIHDETGKLVGAVNVVVDISDRVRAEEMQARLAAIVESSDDAIVSKSREGRIVSWNRGAERLFGYTAEEAIGQLITLIVPEDKLDEERVFLEKLWRGERIDHIETIRVNKKGERLDISLTVSPMRDGSGRIIGASKVARDITDRKRADQSILTLKDELAHQLSDLRQLHEMSSRLCNTVELRPLLDEILQTVVAMEGTDMGLLSLWNAEQNHLEIGASLGFSPEFLDSIANVPSGVGACGLCVSEKRTVIVDDIETDPALAPFRDAARAAGIKSIHSTPLITRSGEVVGVLSVHFRHLHTSSDREMHVLDLYARQAVDFIENARLCARLREADVRKDEFLATLGHELRNPLAPLSNALQILGMSGNLSPTVEGVRSIMERQVKQLVRLVDDLLELSRITRGKIDLRKELVQLDTILENAVETSRPAIKEANHQLTISLPSEPLVLNADPIRLTQVFSNLLNNAAKYTEEGGQIKLTVRREGAEAVVKVRDNGLGIPTEMLSRVFDMFSQVDRVRRRAQGGLGIGLSLAKRLVRMHDGTIEAQSEGPGKGSEFIVRLPLATEIPPQRTAESGASSCAELPSFKVLVVDDTRAAAHVLSKLLEAMGQQVQTANDAHTALTMALHDRPDLVISDISMPDVDGFELARQLRAQPELEGLTLVALTGFGQDSDRQQTKAAGFDFHLVKPVSVDDLKNLLVQLSSASEAI